MQIVFNLADIINLETSQIPTEIMETLQDYEQFGNELFFVSVRSIKSILPLLAPLSPNCKIIGYNGLTISNGQAIGGQYIERESKLKVFEIIGKNKLKYLADTTWNYSFNGDTGHSTYQELDPEMLAENIALIELNEIVSLIIYTKDERIINELKLLPLVVNTATDYVQVTTIEPNIYQGLKAIGIEDNNYIVFGNFEIDSEVTNNSQKHIQIISDLTNFLELIKK